MSRIVIESERSDVPVRITVIEVSWADGIYGLSCTGDGLDECPAAGFEPGDTWGDGLNDCIAAAKLHMLAHERRRCEECGGKNSPPEVVALAPPGVIGERRTCTACGHVEVQS